MKQCLSIALRSYGRNVRSDTTARRELDVCKDRENNNKKVIIIDGNPVASDIPGQKQTSTKRGSAITTLIANYPYIGLFLLLILGGIGIPFFPEDATFILCGFLIQARTVKTVPALFVVYIGVLVADCIIYAVGRKYGRMVVCHRWFHRFLSPEKLTDLEDRFKRKGSFFILLGRHFIGLRVQIFIVSGIMRMHPLKFLLIDAVTVTFTIAVMVSIGYVGGHSLKDLGIHISKPECLAFFCLASFITGYLIFKYIQKRRRL